MKAHHITFLFFINILITSCMYDITPPVITYYTPEHNAIVSPSCQIIVSFSKSMDINKTQNAFSLLYGEYGTTSIDGLFQWSHNNSTMQFIPHESLKNGYYRLIVNTTACDTSNNTLTTQHISTFTVGQDIVPPEIISFTPPDTAEQIPLDTPIIITFSESMNTVSVEKNIHFSPSAQYSCSWDSTNTVLMILPSSNLLFNTWYTIEISSCQDSYNNTMINPYISRFRTGLEYIRPTITGIYTTSITQNMASGPNYTLYEGANIIDDIIITFSEPMDKATLVPALSFSPQATWNAYWENSNQQCTIKFTQPLQMNTQYQIVINTNLKDTAQNSIFDNRIVYFLTNGEQSQQPTIEQLQCLDPVCTLVPFQNSNMGTEHTSNNTYTFTVQFSTQILPASVPENIIIQCLYGEEPDKSGSISRLKWLDYNRTLEFDLSAIEGGNVYKLTFKGDSGGITSLNGIGIQETWYLFYLESND